jgi:1,6-anhydro-N-acetylmuramate kinase
MATYPLRHILDYPDLDDQTTLDIVFDTALAVVKGNEHVRASLMPGRVREWDEGFAQNTLDSLEAMRLVTLRRVALAGQARDLHARAVHAVAAEPDPG